jgi:Rps23 Pro-64 3,4-dihydroxylase Tpa1-like proline 4-hydroxylase
MQNEPIFDDAPSLCVFRDFLPFDEWEAVDKYCRNNEDKFEFFGDNPLVGYKKQTHSKIPTIEFQTAFPTTEEQIEKGDYLTDREYFKNLHHEPTDERVYQVLNWMSIRIRDMIRDIYGNKTYYEGSPLLSMAKVGAYLETHCDGFFLGKDDAVTDFTSVYYINDDYEGGELYMPILGTTIKPKANSLILWSCSWHEDMAHSVKKVISGTRYMSQRFFTTV